MPRYARLKIEVLIIDDDDDLSYACTKLLTSFNDDFILTSCQTSQESIQKLDQGHFDAVICDFHLGDNEMNGLEILQWVRESGNNIPFIIFTGRGREEIAIKALNLGADYYLEKGDDLLELLNEMSHHIKAVMRTRQTQRALMMSEERYRLITEDQNDFIARWNPDGIRTFVNRSYCRFFNTTEEEAIGTSFFPMMDRMSAEELRNWIGSVNEDSSTRIYEQFYAHNDGQYSWVQWLDRAVFDQEGHIKEFQSVGQDITDKMKMSSIIEREKTRYRDLVTNLSESILMTDLEENLVFVNDAFAKALGYADQELQGRRLLDFIRSDDLGIIKRQNLNRSEGQSAVHEIQLRRKDGEYRTFRISAVPRRNKDNSIIGSVAVLVDVTDQRRALLAIQDERDGWDITETKKTDTKLMKSKAEYKKIFEAAYDAMLLIRNNVIIECNSRALQLFGATRASLLGKKPFELSPIHQPDGTLSRVKEQLAFERVGMEGSQFYKWQHIKSDGTIFDAELSLSSVEMDDEVLYLAVIRDITQRKLIEQAMQEVELKYKLLFETANDAVFLMKDDVFTECNNRALEMFGCTREQILGDTPCRYSPLHQPDGRPSKEKIIEKITAAINGESPSFEWKHIRYDGTPFDAEVGLNSIRIGDDFIIQAVVRDITERKTAEEALKKEERYRTIVNSMSNIIAVFDSKNNLAEMYGTGQSRIFKDQRRLVGSHITSILPEETSSRFEIAMEEVRRHGNAVTIDFQTVLNGNIEWYSTSVSLHEDGESIVLVIRKITEGQCMEQILLKLKQ